MVISPLIPVYGHCTIFIHAERERPMHGGSVISENTTNTRNMHKHSKSRDTAGKYTRGTKYLLGDRTPSVSRPNSDSHTERSKRKDSTDKTVTPWQKGGGGGWYWPEEKQGVRTIQDRPGCNEHIFCTHRLRIFSACCSEIFTPRSRRDCIISCTSIRPERGANKNPVFRSKGGKINKVALEVHVFEQTDGGKVIVTSLTTWPV